MMWWTGHLLALVLMVGVRSEKATTDGTQNLPRINFDKSEKLVTTSHEVLHMELDLYKDDGSILFTAKTDLKTTNGKLTTTVSSGFRFLYGFKQINSTHVAVVDTYDSCVWMINRAASTSKKLLAGTCDASGYADGKPGKFSFPESLELDERNPGHLLVADFANDALRSIEIATGTVNTFPKSSFKRPMGMAWNNGSLLVTNRHYISEVSWDKNGLFTNTIIAGSPFAGFVDGDFKNSRFNYPYDIALIQDGLHLVADRNNRLRLLDLFRRRVSTVCIGHASPCTDGNTIISPSSVLRTNDAVYVGDYHSIIKLTVSSMIRTAAFQTMYNVTCTNLNTTISKTFLQSVIAHKKAELMKICGNDCRMSSTMKPWYTCKDDLLTVTWPTDEVFPADVKTVPSALNHLLKKVMEPSNRRIFELEVLSHNPPVLLPKRNQKGEIVQIVPIST